MSQQRSLPPQDDFARALLRSAEADEPSNAAYAKVAAALGVSTAVGVGASLPAPAALLAGSSGFGRWLGSLGGKLALLGVSGALLVGAGSALLRHRFVAASAGAHGAAPAAAAKPTVGADSGAKNSAGARSGVNTPNLGNALNAALAPGQVPLPDAASSAVAAGEPDVAGEQVINLDAAMEHPGLRPARAATRAIASPAGARSAGFHGSSLPEQVQSLDRARVALASGDAGAALVEIAHYRKAWPKGVFLTEASVLEIEALAKRGERSLAAARAQAFVSAHPDSPQAERLRTLIPAPRAEQP